MQGTVRRMGSALPQVVRLLPLRVDSHAPSTVPSTVPMGSAQILIAGGMHGQGRRRASYIPPSARLAWLQVAAVSPMHAAFVLSMGQKGSALLQDVTQVLKLVGCVLQAPAGSAPSATAPLMLLQEEGAPSMVVAATKRAR